MINDEKMIYLRNISSFRRMQYIPKQPHCARRPDLKLLCSNLCGPLTKKFGDPCVKVWFELRLWCEPPVLQALANSAWKLGSRANSAPGLRPAEHQASPGLFSLMKGRGQLGFIYFIIYAL